MTATDDWGTHTVTPLGATPRPAERDEPAQRDSPLGSLKARRAKQQQTLYLDLLVPGWHQDPDDPAPISVYVRCKPVRPSDVGRFTEIRRKKKKLHPNWLELANADVMVDACVGVYWLEGPPADNTATDEREKLSLRDGDEHGDWTRLDPDLGEALGLDQDRPIKAVDVVFALYPTEAGVVTAVNQLVRWSGVEGPKDAESFFAD